MHPLRIQMGQVAHRPTVEAMKMEEATAMKMEVAETLTEVAEKVIAVAETPCPLQGCTRCSHTKRKS